VWIVFHDVAGLIDLNASPPGLLAFLIRGVGRTESDAASVATTIVRFRTPVDIMPPDAVDSLAPGVARSHPGPKYGLFDSVLELEQVAGVDAELYASLRPFVTVHSRLPGVDTAVASQQLRAVFAAALVGAVGPGRASPGPSSSNGGELPAEFKVRSTRRIYVVRASVEGADQARFLRESVIEISATSPTGFVIRDWSAPSIVKQTTRTAIDTGTSTLPDCRRLLNREQRERY
jgi:general secretion pathway protein K